MAKLLDNLPSELIQLARRMAKDNRGSEVFLVGGAVRDTLLGRDTKDYDLVVRDVPADILETWLAERGKVSLVGKTFGIFKWQPEGWVDEAIDVALPRTEHVSAGTGQYRDFTVQSDAKLPIEEDLARRDFTVNAIALNLSNGELVDPSNGQRDLTTKQLRTVGEPSQRFNEDLSRTLRGIRFACQLDFELETATRSAIQEHSQRTSNGATGSGELLVPREVVARELLKSFIADPARALELLDESRFLQELLPEVTAMKGCAQPPEFHTEGDVFQHTKLALAMLKGDQWQEFFGDAKPSLNTIISLLLHDIGKPLTIKMPEQNGTDRIRTNEHDIVGAKLVPGICERLKLASYVDPERGQVESEIVAWLVQHHLLLVHGKPETLKPATIYRYFLHDSAHGLALQQVIFADAYASVPLNNKPDASLLRALRARLPEIEDKLTLGKLQLLVSGDDIMRELNLQSGPKIGELLRSLEEVQLEGKVQKKSEALAYLKTKL